MENKKFDILINEEPREKGSSRIVEKQSKFKITRESEMIRIQDSKKIVIDLFPYLVK